MQTSKGCSTSCNFISRRYLRKKKYNQIKKEYLTLKKSFKNNANELNKTFFLLRELSIFSELSCLAGFIRIHV